MKKIVIIAVAVVTFFSAGLNVSAAGLKDVFQAKFYADKYKDLYDAFSYDGEKLYEHFQIFGLEEKRVMSPVIDVVKYREMYPDLDAAFGDDWDAYIEHWYTFGIEEGRDAGTGFDPRLYVASYADIKAAFGEDWKAVVNHYLTYGMEEGRQGGFVPKPIVEPNNNISNVTSTPIATDIEYDEQGRIVSETLVDGSGKLVGYREYSYQEDGVTAVAEFSPDYVMKSQKTYNANNIMTQSTVFDETGMVVSTTTWNDDGVISSEMEVDQTTGNQTILFYDTSGVKTTWHEYTSQGVNVKDIFYHSNGVPSRIIIYDVENGVVKSDIQYDESGNPLAGTPDTSEQPDEPVIPPERDTSTPPEPDDETTSGDPTEPTPGDPIENHYGSQGSVSYTFSNDAESTADSEKPTYTFDLGTYISIGAAASETIDISATFSGNTYYSGTIGFYTEGVISVEWQEIEFSSDDSYSAIVSTRIRAPYDSGNNIQIQLDSWGAGDVEVTIGMTIPPDNEENGVLR